MMRQNPRIDPDDDIRAQGRDYENDAAAPRWSLTPTETEQLEAALDAEPRVIPELRALIDAYCNRDSCWLEPGHDGECRPGGCWHAKMVPGYSGPPEVFPGLGRRDTVVKGLAEFFLANRKVDK